MSSRGRIAALLLLILPAAACQRSDVDQHPFETAEPTSASPTNESAPSGDADGAGKPPWTINDPRVTQSSGLARSYRHPGVLYTHNDRAAASPELFAVDASGTRAVLQLDAPALDWEDMASTPDGRLWVADVGDNDEARASVSVAVVAEPAVLASATLPTTTYDFTFPDGPHNAEALLVHPRSGRVYIVTKSATDAGVYVGPRELSTENTNSLQNVARVQAPPNVSAGDFAPDGERLVLRNQGRAFFYRGFGGSPTVVGLPDQPQGESVTFGPDGSHVLLGSEGANSMILRMPVPELAQ